MGRVAGWAGIACVIVAGWTTANPTIYRAGLAFQSLFPGWSRQKVTILAGAIATFGAIFPGLVMQLLGFVAVYGLVLMPMGTVIVLDHWLFPRWGLQQNWAEKTGIRFNVAAGAAWMVSLVGALVANQGFGVDVFFLAIPVWLASAALYLVISKRIQTPGPAAGVTT